MKEFFSYSPLRRLVLLRLLEAAALVVIVVACFVGYQMAKEARLTVLRREVQLGTKPQYALALSGLQGELRERAHDLERILLLIEDPNDIVGFIDDIEINAKSRGITLTVSRIDEVHEVNEAGEAIESRGPFRSIRLKLIGLGDGADLLEYVHDLEQGQRLVTLREWDISYDPTSAVAQSQAEAARQIEATVPAALVVPSAQLNVEIILLVHNEKYAP